VGHLPHASPEAPEYLLLENVDRLLKSPAKQRGRDFAIILSCLAEEGYSVEWRVINAAEYGMPQKRRRTYIYGELRTDEWDLEDRVLTDGVMRPPSPWSPRSTVPKRSTCPRTPTTSPRISASASRRRRRSRTPAPCRAARRHHHELTTPRYDGPKKTARRHRGARLRGPRAVLHRSRQA
jgi:site-specific DNA-cytosine methylase